VTCECYYCGKKNEVDIGYDTCDGLEVDVKCTSCQKEYVAVLHLEMWLEPWEKADE